MGGLSSLPPCDCSPASRGPGAGHLLSCALARAALPRAGAAGPRPAPAAAPVEVPRGAVLAVPGRLDGLGRSRGAVTVVRGVTFRTRLEALVAQRLWELEEAKGAAAGVLLRQPRFDLWTSWTPGMGTPLRFTPDFAVLRPGEPFAVHEAKGPRALESRDFVARLGAFRAMLPWVPVTIWRRDREAGPTALVREVLPPLSGA